MALCAVETAASRAVTGPNIPVDVIIDWTEGVGIHWSMNVGWWLGTRKWQWKSSRPRTGCLLLLLLLREPSGAVWRWSVVRPGSI